MRLPGRNYRPGRFPCQTCGNVMHTRRYFARDAGGFVHERCLHSWVRDHMTEAESLLALPKGELTDYERQGLALYLRGLRWQKERR